MHNVRPRLRSRTDGTMSARISSPRRALFVLAIAVALSTAWTFVLTRRVESDFPPNGSFVKLEGARVRYVEKGHGTPIVLLHGAYGGLEDWRASILDAVAERGRAIAIDRPGHGYSERATGAPLTPAAQARWVHAVLAELGVERAVIVGFSWSGGVAASYALQFPDDTLGVMTVNGALYEWEAITSTTDALLGVPVLGPLFAWSCGSPVAQLFRHGGVERAFHPAQTTPAYAHAALELELRPEGLLVNAAEMRALKPALRLQSPLYPGMRVPLVIVTGLGDQITGPQFHSFRLHETVPGSVLVPVEGAGHQIVFTHPDSVLRALDGLLSTIASSPVQSAISNEPRAPATPR